MNDEYYIPADPNASPARWNRLRELKGEASLSWLWQATGISWAAFHRFFKGERVQRFTAERIAKTAGVDLDWLLTGEGDARTEPPASPIGGTAGVSPFAADPETSEPVSERIKPLSDALFQMASEPQRSAADCISLLAIQTSLDWIEVDVQALEAGASTAAFRRRRTGLRAAIARFLLRFV